MEKAIWGSCRWGYFRWDVINPLFDTVLQQGERQSPRNMGGKTPCIQGSARQGMTRHNVKIPLFDEVMQQSKKRS
jgi:hypothetical protein